MIALRTLAVLLLTASAALADSPEEAAKRMQLPDGFTVRVVAAEPTIRQPVSMSFDERGRLWVLQYLQYPNYAGLKPVKQDQFLRTIWDRVPEPPPRGPKGLDRITILYDPDEHGVYRKSKDFVSGLNIASGFCLGNGGVYVMQPPYLLFYPDKDGDDVPDGDPEVLLSGFGMDDTHSLANSLQWGPDGWLYGAAGSTSTCKIKNPAAKAKNPSPQPPPRNGEGEKAPLRFGEGLGRGDSDVIEFQQGIWRYHPKTKVFELFSEGGGNTYGLDFDKNGQVIAGTNWGGFAMLHQMQGAYYIKGFSKHGPLHNPHAYGYFDHVPYTGFKGGHVTCGGIIYQGDTFPKEYHDQYIAGNLLSNAIYWHKLEPNGSTLKARHGGDLMTTTDVMFRPVDLMLGPDGSVYVADWTDKRAAHLDPVDNWEKDNGRIYKIEYKGTPKYPTFDLRKKTGAELVELLKHPNAWWRREARRLLAERQDATTYPALKALIETEKGTLALEALWVMYELDPASVVTLADGLLAHSNEHIRAWIVRMLGDHPDINRPSWERSTQDALKEIAAHDSSRTVLAQLACTAKRFPVQRATPLLVKLMRRTDLDNDPYIPLLIWWAVEGHVDPDPTEMTNAVWSGIDNRPASLALLDRFIRRLLTDGKKRSFGVYRPLLARARELGIESKQLATVIRATETAVDSGSLFAPHVLAHEFVKLREKLPGDDTVMRILAKLGDAEAIAAVRARTLDGKQPEAERLKWIATAAKLKGGDFAALWLEQLPQAKTDAMRNVLLDALSVGVHPKAAAMVLQLYPAWSAAVKKKAVSVLLSRPAWAAELLQVYDAGTFPKADLTLDHAKMAAALNDPAVTKLVEKHFGKLTPATAGEKLARINWLDSVVGRGKADVANGKKLFTQHCATCHTLHGEGGKVGPDLTTADRKNRKYMLTQIVDPSGYIRPEYVSHKVTTLDGRTFTGLVSEATAASVTLVNVIDNKPQQMAVARKDLDELTPLAVSVMPEKLLDTLKYEEIADLFAYLASDKGNPSPQPPPRNGEGEQNKKKLRVGLVSGSLEYKSDESLAAFQKLLEEAYPVECVRAFRKTDTDIPGLDQLATCDVVIFYTRRLKIEGDQLERVKKYVESGKPVIGIRTASHGFQTWLDMDKLVFGGDYKNHYGAGPKCDVKLTEAGAKHPVLAGVKPFQSVGSLYKNPDVAKDITVLQTGSIPDHTEPITWVRERKVGDKTQRVFYTSLGHPDDFKEENFTRMLVNALSWTTKTELKKK